MCGFLEEEKVSLSGTIVKILVKDKSGVPRVVLEKVLIRGIGEQSKKTLFKDHLWIKHTKRWEKVSIGSMVTATAKVQHYVDIHSGKIDRVGLTHIRNIKEVILEGGGG